MGEDQLYDLEPNEPITLKIFLESLSTSVDQAKNNGNDRIP